MHPIFLGGYSRICTEYLWIGTRALLNHQDIGFNVSRKPGKETEHDMKPRPTSAIGKHTSSEDSSLEPALESGMI